MSKRVDEFSGKMVSECLSLFIICVRLCCLRYIRLGCLR